MVSKAADPVAEMVLRAKLSVRNQFSESEVVYANGSLDYERIAEAMATFALDEIRREQAASGQDARPEPGDDSVPLDPGLRGKL